MSNKFSEINLSTVLPASAITISVGSAVYFYREIDDIKNQLNQVKNQLVRITGLVDPNVKSSLENFNESIKTLESKLKNIKPKTSRTYIRYTQPTIADEDDDEDITSAIKALKD